MGGLFTAISGTFTKPMIIGALFPATLFLAAVYFLLLPIVPWELQDVARFTSLETQWKAVAITVTAVIIAFVLYVLNTPIIRLYEGYPWQDSELGKFMKSRKQGELDKATSERDQIHPLRMALDSAGADNSQDAQKLTAYERELINIQWNLYPRRASVLPTRLGNVIRSFENYAERQYGFSAIALWPRFIPRIEQAIAGAIDDAKGSFDFALNASLLSAILSWTFLLLGLLYPVWRISTTVLVLWIAKVLLSAILSWLSYLAAINRAADWGALVRTIFDLYRRGVLSSLGFTEVPRDLNEERRLWKEVSRQIAWGDRWEKNAPPLRFAPAPDTLSRKDMIGATEISPAKETLTITRTIEVTGTPPTRTVHLRIANKDSTDVPGVAITESLSSTRQLVFDSIKLDQKPLLSVRGSNPYVFDIGVIAAGAQKELTYQVADE